MLNEEEKKAIEMLDKYIYDHKVYNIKHSNGLEDCIETVLNLIPKLLEENEDIKSRKEHQEKRFKKYKENIEKQHEEIYENLVSEKEKYVYLYQKALNNTIKSDRENIQLKKQIDLMARAFKQDDVRSVEEIKEYFEELAKEKGE